MGEEIDGKEVLNSYVAEMTGGAVDMETIQQFVGGEVSIERIMNFVGDVNEEEITTFINKISTLDEATIQNLMLEFGGEVTYERLEEKLGVDFTLRELIDYIEAHTTAAPQQ